MARWLFGAAAVLAGAPLWAADAHFGLESIEKGRELFHRTCAQCHGRNMVNSGTTVYDLRKFPLDQPDRFKLSVLQGKGAMPSWRGTLSPADIDALWSYVAGQPP